MMTPEIFLDELRTMLFTGGAEERALVESWRDAARAKLTAGGGALTITVSASTAGKSGSVQVILDPGIVSAQTTRALFELDYPDAFQPEARITPPPFLI